MQLDPYESMGFHCNLTVKAFLGVLGEKLKGTDISPSQFLALANLTALGPLSQSELADRLAVTGATTARLIDRMERDEWVRRERAPEDQRVKMIIPTEKAAGTWQEISAAGREVLDQAYQGISKEELETVKKVLQKIRTNLER
ncbi:MAG: MarR family transcriptional regulator [Candidatus Electrothrix aestuarii]|uniref:MarR family transcriptional regulator n=1 Tax=Candidatus Electrothrix aestuarii TaxID=3062594 RepID=A0AAU8LZB4_9BACT|nr:MarR family transcriptional regulator [Candidatus Electrothrix aestuarii]